jgi:hypothetical protein
LGPDTERLDPVNQTQYVSLPTTLPEDGKRCILQKVVFTFLNFRFRINRCRKKFKNKVVSIEPAFRAKDLENVTAKIRKKEIGWIVKFNTGGKYIA